MNTSSRQPAATAASRAQAADMGAAFASAPGRRFASQADINRSPRMVAQRSAMQAAPGSAPPVQRFVIEPEGLDTNEIDHQDAILDLIETLNDGDLNWLGGKLEDGIQRDEEEYGRFYRNVIADAMAAIKFRDFRSHQYSRKEINESRGLDPWPGKAKEPRGDILARAIELTDAMEQEFLAAQGQHGVPTTVEDSPSGVYATKGGTPRDAAHWPATPRITPDEWHGLNEIADDFLDRYDPAAFAFIMLGNSPAPLHEILKRRSGTVTLVLPLSNLEPGVKAWDDPTMAARMVAYLDRYIGIAKLQGRGDVVIVDAVGKGNGLVGAEEVARRYYSNKGQAIGVSIHGLQAGLRRVKLDDGSDEKHLIPGLIPRSEAMARAMAAISYGDLKLELGYGSSFRTGMHEIFGSDSVAAGFDRQRYLTMMIDLLRAMAADRAADQQ